MAGIEYLSPEGLRVDGRRPVELRKLECQMGRCQQADGSVFLEQGNTKVIATVYGPHDVSRRSEALHDRAYINCQYSLATFSTSERKKRLKGDRQCTEISHALRQTFEAAILTELYPLSKIDIFVQVLQSDGSNQSVCINAITMALIDAGIPMKDYVCSCTVSLINDAPLTDLNYLEEMAGFPELVLAILPKSCKIILLQISSRLHTDNLDSLMSAAMEGSKRVHTILDKIIKGHLQNSTISLAI